MFHVEPKEYAPMNSRDIDDEVEAPDLVGHNQLKRMAMAICASGIGDPTK